MKDYDSNVGNSNGFYIVIPQFYLDIVNHRQAILMGVIASLSNKHGYCYAFNSSIKTILNTSNKTLERDLMELTSKGLIRREIVRDDFGVVIQRRLYVNVTPPPPQNDGYLPPKLTDTLPVNLTDTPPPQIGGIDNYNTYNKIDNKIDNTRADFDHLWKLYGKRGVKSVSKKSWDRLTNKQRRAVMEFIPSYIANHQQADKLNFLPHLSTFINQRRWEDELPYPTLKTTKPNDIDWG